MITWLQNFFLKHNKWLFGGLLIVIIVTFVLTIGPQSFFGSGSSTEQRRLQFHGYDLASEADQRTIAQHAEISSFLNPELQLQGEQIMNYAYIRLAALGLADQLGIPEPGVDSLKAFIQSLRAFQDPVTQSFSADSYQRIVDTIENSGRFSPNALGRVLREDYRIAEVRQALGGPDYTLPFEVDRAYLDAKSNFVVNVLHYDLANFNPDLVADDQALVDFYNENPARYEVPESISVTALMFRAEAYLSEISDPEGDVLEAYFAANKGKYQPTPAAENDTETPEVALADVLETVVLDWKTEQAKFLAARKCEQFSVQLWQRKIALGSPEYEALLAQFLVEQAPIPTYARGETPRSNGLPFQLFESVWAYANNSNRFFSDLANTSDGAGLLVINEVIEARQPDFSEVREEVRTAFMESEKRRLFAEKGKDWREALLAGLSEKSIEDLAADLELELVSLDAFNGDRVPFSLRRNQLWDQVRFLTVGDITPMTMDATRGTFAYLKEKTLPDLNPESEDYQQFLQLRGTRADNAMGWARLRQITDRGLETLFPSQPVEE
jgi:peptidyl-prolyl cis-trans isomerase D